MLLVGGVLILGGLKCGKVVVFLCRILIKGWFGWFFFDCVKVLLVIFYISVVVIKIWMKVISYFIFGVEFFDSIFY